MTLPIEVAVLRLGKFSHRESAYSHLGFNATKLLKEAKLFATTDNRLFILAWDGDKAVGVMAAMVADYFFSDDLVANDYLWYVFTLTFSLSEASNASNLTGSVSSSSI